MLALLDDPIVVHPRRIAAQPHEIKTGYGEELQPLGVAHKGAAERGTNTLPAKLGCNDQRREPSSASAER